LRGNYFIVFVSDGYETELEDFYRYDSRAVRVPWLECVNRLPPRTPLAGPIGFAPAFCNEAKKESPRSAAIAAEFRAHARPQPSFTAPLPDLPRPDVQRPHCRKSKGRSDKWA
jgi:hypothetical protein